ncbi:GDSL-type esterase/lipase family protein [Planctomyces sp. SH-PL14]|uniref:GDSL-type esterase/lipase family protein n=1 Tax=Planctomyces sp. SH-PL14 TaxID=1632864 RepID=UPI0009462C92|nr:GDSL-type esterase/lipase family protein [Planctomyces sp. SH-PL14]
MAHRIGSHSPARRTVRPLITKLLLVLLGAGWTIGIPVRAQEAAKESPPAVEGPAKWEKEIRKFEDSDVSKPPAAGGIVFTGSSTIRLWDLAKSFPDLPVINRGFGGSQMNDAAHFAPRTVLPYHPKAVVLYSGDNDIKNKKTAETVVGDLKAFCQVVHEHLPETKILMLSIKPSPSRWSMIEEQREANRLATEFARTTNYLQVIDVEPVMMGKNGEPDPALFVKDMLHMSEEGYARWTALLKPHLREATAPRVFTDEKPLSDARLKPQRTYNDAYHPWTPPTTVADWAKSAARIHRQLLVACGLWPMPEKTPLQPVIHGKVDRDDFTVERVSFFSRPGLLVTGSLYRPKNASGKIPGVLCPHGHWANGRFYDAGEKGVAEQFKLKAETRESAARYPLQARMVHLARMGCVVFHYDMIGYADQKPLDHRGGLGDAEASLWLQNPLGLQTWNSIRALDFLLGLPDVDPKRIGVTGASGGGTQTFMLFALDDRPTVAFPAVMVGTAMQGGCVCENADYLRLGINNVAIAAKTAPRPLGMVGADDWTIDIETKGLPELKQVYSLFGRSDLVSAVAYKQFPHNYNEKSRERMYAWFKQHLPLAETAPLTESDFKPLSQEELTVFTADHPLPAESLPADKLRERLTQDSEAELRMILPKDPAGVEAYRMVTGGALAVMFGESTETGARMTSATDDKGKPLPADPEPVAAEIIGTEELADSITLIRGMVRRTDSGEQIPAIAMRPTDDPKGLVVLWIDSQGKAVLLDEAGGPNAMVRKLTGAGITVASIDPFLTGESREAAAKKAGDKPLYPVNLQYPGYTFGYNAPLLAHRVRDIVATARALRAQQGFQKLAIVAQGEAGLWAALANAASPGTFDWIWADLDGFSFDAVKTPDSPSMLPGAKKYGGVGGLVGLGAGTTGALHQLAEKDAERAKAIVTAAAGPLTIEPKPLEIDAVVARLIQVKPE